MVSKWKEDELNPPNTSPDGAGMIIRKSELFQLQFPIPVE